MRDVMDEGDYVWYSKEEADMRQLSNCVVDCLLTFRTTLQDTMAD